MAIARDPFAQLHKKEAGVVFQTSSTGNDGISDYTYDDTGQLTGADHDYQTDESYSYDENGNRTMTGYTTGTNNQITSDGTFNYTYDDEGNRATRTRTSGTHDDYTTEYAWDHHNRLVEIKYKNNSGTVTKEIDYTFDVFGRRIMKTIDADGAGAGAAVDTEYVYDGVHILLAFDDAGDLINRYLHGPVVDMILADEEVTTTSSDGDIQWTLTDNLGSVRDIIDSSGAVENHITYDAYGNITSETDTAVDHIFGYTGRERDEESDLQFNRARFYDPLVGRWASEDPIGFLAGDSNLNRYVWNGSTNGSDAFGLQSSDSNASSSNSDSTVSNDGSPSPSASTGWEQLRDGLVEVGPLPSYEASPYGPIGKAAIRFGEQMEDEYGAGADEAGRHMMWMALLTLRWGAEIAEDIGDIHERYSTDREDTARDQFNNQIGLKIGTAVADSTERPFSREGVGRVREMIIEAIENDEAVRRRDDPRLRGGRRN